MRSTVDQTIEPGQRHIIGTGLSLEIPAGYVGLIWDRSGLAAKAGLTTLGGVIDSNYRGEVGIILLNTGHEPYQVKRGDRVAQILIQKIEPVELEEVEAVTATSRGHQGFGSSGR